MKNLIGIGLVVLFSSTSSVGMPVHVPVPPKKYELMKCSSYKIGTLWASFGNMTRSGESEPAYFPTEIILIENGIPTRITYPDFREALKVDLSVGAGRLRLGFSVDSKSNFHLLQVYRPDQGSPSSFMGNWTKRAPDGTEVMDLVGCTLT